jgi:hypothetical protein
VLLGAEAQHPCPVAPAFSPASRVAPTLVPEVHAAPTVSGVAPEQLLFGCAFKTADNAIKIIASALLKNKLLNLGVNVFMVIFFK